MVNTAEAGGRPPIRVVTIARQHGTGGELIARAVAKRLGFRFVDYEVLREAADEAGVSAEVLRGGTQHRGFLDRLLEALGRTGASSADMWMHPVVLRDTPLYTSREYRAFIEEAIRDLAEQGSVVILGYGAQLVLGSRPDTYRVLISGSLDVRIDRAAAEGVSREEAEKTLREADHERVSYFKEFYDEGWLDPATYDLIINTDRTSPDEATAMIAGAIATRLVPAG